MSGGGLLPGGCDRQYHAGGGGAALPGGVRGVLLTPPPVPVCQRRGEAGGSSGAGKRALADSAEDGGGGEPLGGCQAVPGHPGGHFVGQRSGRREPDHLGPPAADSQSEIGLRPSGIAAEPDKKCQNHSKLKNFPQQRTLPWQKPPWERPFYSSESFRKLTIILHKAHSCAAGKIAQFDACFFSQINYNQLKHPGRRSPGRPWKNDTASSFSEVII